MSSTLHHSTSIPQSADPIHIALNQPHLSEDQIDDQLLGDLAALPALHLVACSLCADRVAAAAQPISSFASLTMAWSERRSATLPLPDLSGHKPLYQRQMAWGTAFFAIALGIALTNAGHQVSLRAANLQASVQTSPTVAQPTALTESASISLPPREATISADNHMLKAIDDELQTASEDPAALGLELFNQQPSHSPAPAYVQD